MSKQRISFTVNGVDMDFDVTLEAYSKYINEITMNNKLAPAKNFLNRTVAEESKASLRDIINKPGVPLQLASAVLEEYLPEVELVIKK